MKPTLRHDGCSGRFGPEDLPGKSALNENKIQDIISSSPLHKKSTETIFRKRPHTKSLLAKLEQVLIEHLKENEEGCTSLMVSSEIISWIESSHKDIAEEKDKEDKVTEFSVKFSFTTSTVA